MTTAKLLLNLFRGRPDVVAVAPAGSHFRPVQLPEPLKPEWVEAVHFTNVKCLGIYPLLTDSTVWCSAIDFDDKPEAPDPLWLDKMSAMYYAAAGYEIHTLAELSHSGRGGHLWAFYDSPIPAYVARQKWYALARRADVTLKEIYPRQDTLPPGGYGNLIRLPLAGESHFFDIETGERQEPLEALQTARRTTEHDARTCIYSITGAVPRPPEEPVQGTAANGLSRRVNTLVTREGTLLAKRWKGDCGGMHDDSRSALVQSIANELVRQYVPTHEIAAAIKHWCAGEGYAKGDRDDFITRTVESAYQYVTTQEKPPQASNFVEAAAAYLEARKRGLDVIPFDVAELDSSIDGVGRGQVCVVAARPSHGKSILAVQWAMAAAQMGKRAFMVSEEMQAVEIGQRIFQRLCGDNDTNAKQRITDYFAGQFAPIIECNVGDIDDLERRVLFHKADSGIDVVVVDYLQLLKAAGSRYEAVTEISRRLKQLAGREGLYMMVLSQMNRQVEGRDGRLPSNADLRESGQIEQDADIIMFLTWPWQYDHNHAKEDYLFFVSKRRNGPIRQRVIPSRIWPERSHLGIAPPEDAPLGDLDAYYVEI
jgi:KaiC/GvpD/RAD55 family RecA-like ATPase